MMKKKKSAASLVDSQQCRRKLVYVCIVEAAIFNFFKKTTQITLRSCLEAFLLLLRQRFFVIAVFMNGTLGSTLNLA